MTYIEVDTAYWLHHAPAMLLLAFGVGLGVMALTQGGRLRRGRGQGRDRLGAAELRAAARRRAGSRGLGRRRSDRQWSPQPSGDTALLEGYGTALLVAAGVLVASAVAAATTLSSRVRSDELVR